MQACVLAPSRQACARARRRARAAAIALVAIGCAVAGCATWKPVLRFEGWTLYVRDRADVDPVVFEEALLPAFEAVEERLGPFGQSVRVHAWHGGVRLESGNRGEIRDDEEEDVTEYVPGIGPAQVRAFHSSGGLNPLTPRGVFLGEPDVGTAVHELVHARLSELDERIPLWFEEGLACLLADGALIRGRWVVDGLFCWPIRELRDEYLSERDLERLLRLKADEEHSVRDNVLVHFLGWALVFDLRRDDPTGSWRDWLATGRKVDAGEARARLRRVLDERTVLQWLDKLDDPDAGVRLAASRGLCKLATPRVLERMTTALEKERDPEVRLSLAVNLVVANENRILWGGWSRLRRASLAALGEVVVPDAGETRAARQLYKVCRQLVPPEEADPAFAVLRRFWEE